MSPELITLSRADLDRLLADAAARAVAQSVALNQAAWLDNAQAAQLVYNRPDRVSAFRALRYRHPVLDTISVGKHRMRRWRSSDLEALLIANPDLRRAAIAPADVPTEPPDSSYTEGA